MPTPEGKFIFGTVKVGERGQIVIPKDAREVFGINPGDSLVVLGNREDGLALMKNEAFLARISPYFDQAAKTDPTVQQDKAELYKLVNREADERA